MKPAVLVMLALSLASVAAADWSLIGSQLEQATVFIKNAKGSCTGFVIHSAVKKGNTDFVLTAAHCDGDELFADHVPATVRFKDDKRDLMVLEVEDLERPALALAAKNPAIAEDVASFGYGYGLDQPMFRIAHVSSDKTYIPSNGIGGPFIMIDAAFVPGQSGGPVVNAAGDIVMIVQMGTRDGVGLGVGAEVIRKAVGRFFEHKR
jgi:S1-C subfamily serine protease